MKVVFFGLEKWQIPLIQEKLKNSDINLITYEEHLDDNIIEEVKDADIISLSGSACLGKNRIDKFTNLRLITTRNTGYDHINFTYAEEKGIQVANVPSYGSNTVAEYTFALILSLAKKLRFSFDNTSRAWFSRKHSRGIDLAGKTLGVIGTGKIASKVVRMAHGFDMRIIAFSRTPNISLAEKYNVEYMKFDDVLRNADIITLHVPYTRETHHMINPETIRLLKKGALLVNTARGKIVDIKSVLDALRSGHLGGVAFDTFEGENIWLHHEKLIEKDETPPIDECRAGINSLFLLHYENAILTPHNAFNTHEAIERILETNIDCIISFIETGDPKTSVMQSSINKQ
jgi:D-lactate dehydrogenase